MRKKYKIDFGSTILIILFVIFITTSIVRTVYNFSKLATEERQWYYLSDEEKRAKQFGDVHYFLRFVQKYTDTGSNILFFTDDTKAYFLSRYYLYPTTRAGKYEGFLWNNKESKYNYYMIYPANHKELIKEISLKPELKNYKKIATYRGANGEIGLLYKR
jgi:hypothetical protein